MININYRDHRPIYEQVRDNFRQMIVTGVLPKDSRLPSVRELAVSLAINPNTIQRAYRELEAEGFICSVPGKGSFVCDIPPADVSERAALITKFVELSEQLEKLGVSRKDLIGFITEENKYD